MEAGSTKQQTDFDRLTHSLLSRIEDYEKQLNLLEEYANRLKSCTPVQEEKQVVESNGPGLISVFDSLVTRLGANNARLTQLVAFLDRIS